MAVCLLAVFVTARLIIVAAHPVESSAWMPAALLWQDTLIVLLFAAIENVSRWRRPVIALYALIVGFVAFSLPVVRVLGTPLTAPMLRAARGTLADSILYHVSLPNVAALMLVIAVGVAMPLLWRSGTQRDHEVQRRRIDRVLVAFAVAVVMAGYVGAGRTDTRGLERNALITLARSAIPRVRAASAASTASAATSDGLSVETAWRTSPLEVGSPNDAPGAERPTSHKTLQILRGSAPHANVMFIVLESTAAQYLRAFGAVTDPTPNISALARRSIVFRNAYSVYPESVKGLTATLASRYPAFDVPAEQHAALMSPSLASALRSDGYASALFHSGRFAYLGMQDIVDAAGFDRREDAGDIGGNHASSFGVDESAAVARVLAWIDSVPRGQPFLAAYLPIAAHHPYAYTLPGPFSEAIEIDRYRNALHEGDAAIGRLLAGLAARGLDASTVIVIMGDHGEAFGQHRDNYGHDLALYEENVHVPLMISLPANLHQTTTSTASVTQPVSAIDVAPTILDLVGVRIPAAFQGVSLLDGRHRMALFFTDYSLGLLGLRDGCMKFIYEMESRRSRLFDVCSDESEQRDIAEKHASRAAVYTKRLQAWSAAQVSNVRNTGTSPR